MNKPNKKDTLNLIFSAFLILGYIVCAFFFLSFAENNAAPLAPYINTLVFAVFGLVVFYATRVGEGKPVKRFSLWTLVILVIPSLYIIVAQFVSALPFHNAIANMGGMTALTYSPLPILASIALGYGLPYTFFSGYEMKEDAATDEAADDTAEDFAEVCECCGTYVLCDSDTEGALMVVDDLDTAFDVEKDIRISDVSEVEGVKVGAYVVFTKCTCCGDTAEDTAETEVTPETEE